MDLEGLYRLYHQEHHVFQKVLYLQINQLDLFRLEVQLDLLIQIHLYRQLHQLYLCHLYHQQNQKCLYRLYRLYRHSPLSPCRATRSYHHSRIDVDGQH